MWRPACGDERHLRRSFCGAMRERKASLEKLLGRRADGISVAPFECGQIGPDLFWAACRMGLEGIVCKHRERRIRRAVPGIG